MSYTEQDVERVAEALCVAEFDNEYWETLKDGADGAPDAHTYQREVNHYLVMARAALEAMAREPIEDVLRAQHVYNIEIEPAGPNYYAEVVSAAHDRRTGTGATIADAIRNAVAAAKEQQG